MFIRILILIAALSGPALRAAPSADPVLTRGLQLAISSGLESCLETWYAGPPGHPEIHPAFNARIVAETKSLGDIFDAEVLSVQSISKRVTRYYVAIYFARRPVWISIERYASRDQSFYLPLKYSMEADDILPAAMTEFPQ